MENRLVDARARRVAWEVSPSRCALERPPTRGAHSRGLARRAVLEKLLVHRFPFVSILRDWLHFWQRAAERLEMLRPINQTPQCRFKLCRRHRIVQKTVLAVGDQFRNAADARAHYRHTGHEGF